MAASDTQAGVSRAWCMLAVALLSTLLLAHGRVRWTGRRCSNSSPPAHHPQLAHRRSHPHEQGDKQDRGPCWPISTAASLHSPRTSSCSSCPAARDKGRPHTTTSLLAAAASRIARHHPAPGGWGTTPSGMLVVKFSVLDAAKRSKRPACSRDSANASRNWLQQAAHYDGICPRSVEAH